MLGKLSRRVEKRLLERGKRAPAVVVKIAERGMSVTSGPSQVVGNTELVLKTCLRVEPSDEPAFEVEQKFRFPQLAIPPVGTRLSVLYDPNDHSQIMIDHSSQAAIGQTFAGGVATPGGLDPTSIAATVQEAREQSGGDQQAMAKL